MKVFYYFAICIMCCSVVSASELKVPNNSFEKWSKVKNPQDYTCEFTQGIKPSGWNVGERTKATDAPKTVICSQDTEIFHSGKSSIKLESKDNKFINRISRFNAIPIEGGKQYKVSFWVKGENIASDPANKHSGVVLQFIPGSKKHYWSDKRYLIKVFPLKGSFDWMKISAIFETRDTEESAGIAIGLQKATGVIWVDDLELEQVSREELLEGEKSERKSKVEPTVWREHYGPNVRQVFSIYSPKSEKPTPLLVYIHGGGWLRGDGLKEANSGKLDGMIQRMNRKNIAVAVINYRYSPLPSPVMDAARAIQYLRANAQKYNLDKTKFAATGFSAGATTSLWLATHDDLADPEAEDLVLRESTRLSGVRVIAAQATIDPVTIREWNIEKALGHPMISRAAGFTSNKQMDANYEKKKELYLKFSPVTHIDKNDPPIRLETISLLDRNGDYIHHSRFAFEFYKIAKDKGADVDIFLRGKDKELAPTPKDKSGEGFLIRVLTSK